MCEMLISFQGLACLKNLIQYYFMIPFMFWDIWKYCQADGFLPQCVKHRNRTRTKVVWAVVLFEDFFLLFCQLGEERVAGGKKYCWRKNVHFPLGQPVMGWEIPVRTGTKLTIRGWKWPWPSNRSDYHRTSDFPLRVCSETVWSEYQ